MKLTRYPVRKLRGFTLTELMVTIAVSSMVVGGVILSHITGLKMYEIAKAKLGITDDTRLAVSLLVNEVRTGKTIRVGRATNFTTLSFTPATDGSLQEGNAVQIYPTSGSTPCIQYYLNTNTAKLFRSLNGTNPRLIAENVTNAVVFTSEDYLGNVLTQNQDNRVLAVTLNFYQLPFNSTRGGTNQVAEGYTAQTKIARRVL